MTIHPATNHPTRPETTSEEHTVQYQSMEILATARQEALSHEAELRRSARLLQRGARRGGPASLARGTPADDTGAAHPATHDHDASHVPGRSRLAGLRLRLGHALVNAGMALEGGTAEDPIRSH